MLDLLLAFYLQLPIVIGGVLHMVVVTRDLQPQWRHPIHEAWFGRNKTWRGLILMPAFAAAGGLTLLPWLEWQSCLAGAAAGLGYVLAELPNSFIKRRLGIAPGALPSKHSWLGVAVDQLDSGIGAAVAYALYPGISLDVCALYVVTFPLTALVVKRLLYMGKLKKSAV